VDAVLLDDVQLATRPDRDPAQPRPIRRADISKSVGVVEDELVEAGHGAHAEQNATAAGRHDPTPIVFAVPHDPLRQPVRGKRLGSILLPDHSGSQMTNDLAVGIDDPHRDVVGRRQREGDFETAIRRVDRRLADQPAPNRRDARTRCV